MNEELDPEDLVVQYQQPLGKFDQIAPQTLSDRYLTDAKELLKKGDLAQATEKLWGASALAVKRIGAKKGLKLEEHGSLWSFVNMLAMEGGDKDLTTLFHVANSVHQNFYEDEMKRETVEIAAVNIEQLITKLKEVG